MQLFNVNNELKTSHYSSIKRKRKKKEIVEFLSRWEKKVKKKKKKKKKVWSLLDWSIKVTK